MNVSSLVTDLYDEVEVDPGRGRAVVSGTELESLSARELSTSLAITLYDRFHARRAELTDPLEGFAHIRDSDFESRLAESVRDIRTSYDVREEGAGVVLIEGVRVRLNERQVAQVLPRPGRSVLETIGARPALTPGFFLVRSSPWTDPFGGLVLRLYVRVATADRAPAVWAAAMDRLRELRTPWQAKILSHPASYPRSDALVVYLPRSSWRAAAGLADALAPEADGEGPTSLYARELAPGVTLAFEPDDARVGYTGLSFGQHRSRALAEALVATAGTGRDAYLRRVEHDLVAANVDPLDLARNLSTPSFAPLGVAG